jgi:tRNA1Val (adenine37-N6)-methyltransferase
MSEPIGTDESLDILCQDKLRIIQKKDGYRFSIDAILLANFITLKKHERLLDIGTGCGIIPIYMARKGCPNNMAGIEVQEDLFDLAVKNGRLNGCHNVDFMKGNVTALAGTLRDTPFHVVASNPPYTKAGSGRTSPGVSRRTARYESDLDLSHLLAAASSVLTTKGRFYIVYPSRRLGELVQTAKQYKLEPKRLRFVYPREGSPSNLMLGEFMKQGRPGTTVDKPLNIHVSDDYSDEVKTYYSLKG